MIMRTVVTDAFQFILIRSGWGGGDLSRWISFVVVVFNRGLSVYSRFEQVVGDKTA